MRAEIMECLRGGPADAARQAKGFRPQVPPPTRWELGTIRATLDWLGGYSLSGVWYLLKRCGLKVRSAGVQQHSPDPDYGKKVFRLKKCLRQAARQPRSVAALFLDEFGYTGWPEPGRDWGLTTPIAARSDNNNQQWRTIGALNALTGRVSYLDNYRIGRRQLIQFYKQLDHDYHRMQVVYVIQDNWSVHQPPEVMQALAAYPRLQVVWLPTDAPGLNPIEKLWRWIRQDILKLHRLAEDWAELRHRVRLFLDQFEHRSCDLLRYVGLLGDGLLAKTIHLA